MFDKINSPITLNGMTLKNKIVFAPTSFGLAEEEYLAKLKAIAEGGTALIIIGDVPAIKTRFGKSLYSKKGFAFYKRVVDTVHAGGAKVSAQLHVSDSDIMGMIKYIPGVLTKKISKEELRPLLNNGVGKYISGLSTQKVKKITASFGTAALLAQQAGFDMVQVHGDRMCGSFSSEVFNSRKDCYGGSAENRARFAMEAVSAIRKKLPNIPIEYKLAVRQESPHYGNAGVVEAELGVFVPILEKAGVNCFHVALANHSELMDTIPQKKHPYFSEQGCFLKYSDEVRRYTKLPLCGVGTLTDPQFVEEQLANGRIDYAAMSRQLIADPQWVNKTASGNADKINHCTRCNKACLGGIQQHKGVHCIFDKK